MSAGVRGMGQGLGRRHDGSLGQRNFTGRDRTSRHKKPAEAGFLFFCFPEEDLNLHDHKSLTPEASASTIPPSGLRARTVKVGLGHCQSAWLYGCRSVIIGSLRPCNIAG